MTYRSRPYEGRADLDKLIGFLVAATSEGLLRGYFHVGDLVWGLYQNTIYDPRANIRLWEQGTGELAGFTWFEEPSLTILQIRPDLQGDTALATQMLDWAQERAAQLQANDPDAGLWTRLPEDDQVLGAFFAGRGFERDEYFMHLMHRPIDSQPAAPVLPEGFTVRAVGGEDEWPARVELHRSVWAPSRVTLEAYRNLRTAPGYLPDLDIVVVAPDGALASYGICWLDQVNAVGEFEPVGTHPDHRGLGLGKALMQEGLRRLYARGAQRAIVYSVGSNVASRRLYESVGFEIVKKEHLYGKQLNGRA